MSEYSISEAEREVKTIQVFLKCLDCNCDTFFHGSLDESEYHEYKCPNCFSFFKSKLKYPYIKYVSK